MILLAVLGVLLIAAGIAGLAHCIHQAARIRKAGPSTPETVARLRGLIAVNLASVGGAALGLACLTMYFVLR
jgi:hypothetical protein